MTAISCDPGDYIITLFNSTTSTGHSGQLSSQHTIKSQPAGSWPWLQKLRLAYSNSILTFCSRSSPTTRHASQSGNSVWMRNTRKPSRSASTPNRKITPDSFVGPHTIGRPPVIAPYIGRSIMTFGIRSTADTPWFPPLPLGSLSISATTSAHSVANPFSSM